MPSRPVFAPIQHDAGCRPRRRSRARSASARSRPTHIALTRQLCVVGRLEVRPRRRRWRRRRSCRSGRCRATTPANRCRGALARRARRSAASRASAIGRAPIAKMSRRMPPTPVAAPWNGSTADGWLWLSTLKATARPSPTSITPAFSPGPCSTRAPLGGEAARAAARSACSRSAPTRAASRRPARSRSDRVRAARRSAHARHP